MFQGHAYTSDAFSVQLVQTLALILRLRFVIYRSALVVVAFDLAGGEIAERAECDGERDFPQDAKDAARLDVRAVACARKPSVREDLIHGRLELVHLRLRFSEPQLQCQVKIQ